MVLFNVIDMHINYYKHIQHNLKNLMQVNELRFDHGCKHYKVTHFSWTLMIEIDIVDCVDGE